MILMLSAPAASPPDPPIGVFDARSYQEYRPAPARLTGTPRRPEAGDAAAPRAPRGILVVGLTASGDVLHFLPVAVALRKAFPEAKLGWVVQDKARVVLDGFAGIDEVHIFERLRWARGLISPARVVATLREILSSAGALRSGGYDLLVDPQGTAKSALVNLAGGVPARVGFSREYGREFNFLTTTARVALPTKRMHRVRKSLALLEAMGIDTREHAVTWTVPEEAQERADRDLERLGLGGKPFMVIHPGTSEFGARKRWPLERFGELADRARAELGLAPVFALGPIERAWEPGLLRAMRSEPKTVVHPASLAHLAGLLRRAACFTGCDSAPLHLASNLRTPVVGLYGPTDPVLFSPYYPPAVVVVKGLPCSRCGAPHCNHKVPRMEAILVDEVLEGIRMVRGMAGG